VGDDDEGEIRGLEQGFEPLNAFEVEVVGGLVEEEDVGVDDEGFRDGETLAPTAAEAGGVSIHAGAGGGCGIGKAGAAEGFAETLLAFVFRHGGSGHGGFDRGAHGDAVCVFRNLMNVADARAGAESDIAGIGLLLAGEHGEEGGLPCSVGANEADARAVVHGEGDVLKERFGAEAFGNVLRIQNRRHGFSVRCGSGAMRLCGSRR